MLVEQLARQRLGDDAVLVGFHTYAGSVYAADEWDEPGRVMTLRPALPESHSALFQATGVPSFVLALRGGGEAAQTLAASRLQRAVGVVYRPDTERQSHYFDAVLPEQFDAWVWFDETRAVTPLPARQTEGAEETWPFGL